MKDIYNQTRVWLVDGGIQRSDSERMIINYERLTETDIHDLLDLLDLEWVKTNEYDEDGKRLYLLYDRQREMEWGDGETRFSTLHNALFTVEHLFDSDEEIEFAKPPTLTEIQEFLSYCDLILLKQTPTTLECQRVKGYHQGIRVERFSPLLLEDKEASMNIETYQHWLASTPIVSDYETLEEQVHLINQIQDTYGKRTIYPIQEVYLFPKASQSYLQRSLIRGILSFLQEDVSTTWFHLAKTN